MGEPRDLNSPKYKWWRRKVFKRDNYRCQFPGCTSAEGLEAHHIKRWADCVKLRFVPMNGLTLCGLHHLFVKDREKDFEAMFFSITKQGNKNDLLKILFLKYEKRPPT